MRITTWDNNGRIVKDAETPTLSEIDRYSTIITSQQQSHKITTRIIYHLPPNDDEETIPQQALAWTHADDRPTAENKRSGWIALNDSWIHTAYNCLRYGYPSRLPQKLKPSMFPRRTTYVRKVAGEWTMVENRVDWTKLAIKQDRIGNGNWNQRVTIFDRRYERSDENMEYYDGLIGDVGEPMAGVLPESGP